MIIIYYHGKPVSINKRYYKNFSLTNEYRTFKEELGLYARQIVRGIKIFTKPLCVEITVYYKGREPDIDAYIKPILDSLQGIVYKNDKQIIRLVVVKQKSTEDKVSIYIDDYT